MDKVLTDTKYISIVNNILDNEEYNKIKEIEHHGISRFDHSVKVSYYSYRVAKMLRLDYIEAARGGLLHDFFLSDKERTNKDKFISTFNHPKKAVMKATDVFSITEREENIIRSHMFPFSFSLPKYAESWVVSLTDKVIGIGEVSKKWGCKLNYVTNAYILFLVNLLFKKS